MIENGVHGAGTGKGFYDWSNPGNPRPRRLEQYIINMADQLINAKQ
jgi:hypothetical protein